MSGVQGIGARRDETELFFFSPSDQGLFVQREQQHALNSTIQYLAEKPRDITLDQLVAQVEKANRFFLNRHTHLQFSIHKETKSIIVRIINSETQEVIKEIPPEKILDLVAKLWEMAGLLIDERR